MSFLPQFKPTIFAALITSVTTVSTVQAFNVQHFGNFKQMMQSGFTTALIKLKDITQATGTWGLDALAGSKGEIILVDGKILVTYGSDPQGKTTASQPTDETVLWAIAQVAQWQEVTVPKNMNQARFEAFVIQQAKVLNLNLDQAFPYRVKGSYTHLIWHVVTGEKEANQQVKSKNTAPPQDILVGMQTTNLDKRFLET